MKAQGKVTLYCCGGGGTNIGSHFANSEKGSPSAADITTAFFDTSRSNMGSHIPEEQCYFLKGADGSGKLRSANYAEILEAMPEFLSKHKPGDVNIVVFTASGGTGSVAGPLLVDSLLERKLNVIALVVGSEESSAAVINTFNTLTGLEANARDRGVNLPLAYVHHSAGRKRSDVDSEAYGMIGAVSVAASRRNDEFDTKDMEMWIDHLSFTKVEPGLNRLFFYSDPNEIDKHEDGILSMIGILKNPDRPQPTRFIPAAWYGYNDLTAISENVSDIFLVLTKRTLPELVAQFRKLKAEVEEQHVILEKVTDSFADANAGVKLQKGGLVL